MLRFAVIAALVALAVAQTPPVILTGAEEGKAIEISEATTTPHQVTFKLAEPIICQNPEDECRVIINITNTRPEQVVVDKCLLVWEKREWYKTKSIFISARQDYVQDLHEAKIEIVTELISPASFYNGFNPPNIYLTTPNGETASCHGVGDPHYRTFDNRRWHQYGTGQTVFYKSNSRDFEVQTYMYRSIARNCAVVGREGRSLAVINACGSSFQAFTRLGCPNCDDNPRIDYNGGNRYAVHFSSGAVIRVTVHGRMLQVYVTAPGSDFKQTEGMCGNNNNIANDDNNIYIGGDKSKGKTFQYVVRHIPDLIDEMQIKTNLFNWHPSDYVEPTPNVAHCDTIPPPYIRPILLNPDSEDITDVLKETSENEEDPDAVIEFGSGLEDAANDEDAELPQVSRERATALCEPIKNTAAVKGCGPEGEKGVLSDADIEEFVDDCVEDMVNVGEDQAFVADAIEALMIECAKKATLLGDDWPIGPDGARVPPDQLVEALCPGATADGVCSGKGVCEAGECVCFDNIIGVDCSIDATKPPAITGIDYPLCDTVGDHLCPHNITLSGTNIYKHPTEAPTCRYERKSSGDVIERDGIFLGLEIACPVLTHQSHTGMADDVWHVSVSNDGEIFSDKFDFTYYDSHCRSCNEFECMNNPGACTIGDRCVLEGVRDPENFCNVCDPASSSTSYTFSYKDSVCRPQFDAASYFGTIEGDGVVGDEIVKVGLRFHEGDPLSESGDYTFSLQTSGQEVPHVFQVDETGLITLKQAVTDDTAEEHNFVRVHYQDSIGNTGSAPLQVDRITDSSSSFFPAHEIPLPVAEDVGVNSDPIIKLEPTDPDAYDNIVYTLHNAEGNDDSGPKFSIDDTTGEITVAQGLDYEQQTEYLLQVEATATRKSDNEPETHITVVKVTIDNVNEGPTNIELSNQSVEENAEEGTEIGTLSAEDPEKAAPVTFSVNDPNGNVRLEGNKLVSAKSFDFESMGDSPMFSVDVTATDGETAVVKRFNVNITNVNEPPHSIVIPGDLTFDEGTDGEIGSVSAVDPEGDAYRCFIYNFTTGGDELVILENKLRVKTSLDYETRSDIRFFVQCADEPNDGSDSLASAVEKFNVHVLDIDESPSQFKLDLVPEFDGTGIPENAEEGFKVGTITATDPDADAPEFGFDVVKPKVNGEEVDSKFEIKDVTCHVNDDKSRTCTGNVHLKNAALDYEDINTETLQVKPTGTGSNSDSSFEAVPIDVPVQDVNDPPSEPRWSLGGSLVERPKTREDRIVGRLEAVDQDPLQSHTFTLKDSPLFVLEEIADRRRSGSGNDGVTVLVKDDTDVDYEANPSMDFTIEITDSGTPPQTKSFTMSVPVSDRPMTVAAQTMSGGALGTSLSLPENAPGAVAKVYLEDHDRADWQYSLVLREQIPSSPAFTLGSDGVLTAPALDFEQITGFVLNFTATVTCTAGTSPCDAPASVVGTIDVSVANVDEAPELEEVVDNTLQKFVTDDQKVGQTFAIYKCVDPDGDNVDVSLSTNHHDVFGVKSLAGNQFAVVTNKVPSTTDLLKDFAADSSTLSKTLGVACSANGKTSIKNHAVEIRNDCFAHQCSGKCVDESTLANPVINSHKCELSLQVDPDSSTGDKNGDGNKEGSSSGIGAGAIAGIIAAMLILALLVLFIVVRRNQQRKPLFADVERADHHTANPALGAQAGAFMAKPADYDDPSAFHPGVANPTYGWYQPDMSRQECTDYLMDQDDGSFVVRDSKATPGWHMLGVKNQGKVIHEKIRMNDEGSYELLPNSNRKQPRFADLPDLVDYYGNPQEGVEYALAISNPMYDNKHLDEGTGYATAEQLLWRRDEAAPVVPIKEKDRAIVEAVSSYNPEGEDLYTNTTEAKAALTRTASGVDC